MKKIILFRHGMSINYSKHLVDHDRILVKKGIEDAKKMGKFLKKQNELPEYVISSSAVRAKTTAELASKSGNWNCKIKIEKKIYGGSPNYLLDLLSKQSNEIDFICLVGHEPNFSNFISMTTGFYKIFSTASMAMINFNVNNWSELYFDSGKLDWFISPEELKLDL